MIESYISTYIIGIQRGDLYAYGITFGVRRDQCCQMSNDYQGREISQVCNLQSSQQ